MRSKAANFWVPFMGWFMFHAGYIPVKRGDKESVAECMERATKWLLAGVSVLFFREGTRSKNGEIQPFKPGAFKLALETGCRWRLMSDCHTTLVALKDELDGRAPGVRATTTTSPRRRADRIARPGQTASASRSTRPSGTL